MLSATARTVTDIRVALRGPVAYAFGGVVGLSQSIVSVRAHVGFTGNLMPIAVRRYINLSGPYAGGLCPDPPYKDRFADLAATQATSCQGAADPLPLGYGVRSPASPSQPGPTIVLIGHGPVVEREASAASSISTSATSTTSIRGSTTTGLSVPSRTPSRTSRPPGSQGYPGPDFPPVTVPADPNDQVAVMDGISAGHIVSNLNARWNVGDRILCALYDGT